MIVKKKEGGAGANFSCSTDVDTLLKFMHRFVLGLVGWLAGISYTSSLLHNSAS